MDKNNENLEKINELLNSGMLTLFEKKRYKKYLEAMSTFPTYSANNQYLIHIQDPEATMVCGYKDWQKKHNRYVCKGEKSRIWIYKPVKRKSQRKKRDANGNVILDPNGNPVMETAEWTTFMPAPVFDVSQTAGEPIDSITSLFSGKVDGYSELIHIMIEISPASIEEDETCEEVKYVQTENRIVFGNSLPQQQIMQGVLPAVAAATIRKNNPDKICRADSLEAESVAYVVATHFGIDADYSFDYIADWGDEMELDEKKAAMSVISKAAGKMIKDISAERDRLAAEVK